MIEIGYIGVKTLVTHLEWLFQSHKIIKILWQCRARNTRHRRGGRASRAAGGRAERGWGGGASRGTATHCIKPNWGRGNIKKRWLLLWILRLVIISISKTLFLDVFFLQFFLYLDIFFNSYFVSSCLSQLFMNLS